MNINLKQIVVLSIISAFIVTLGFFIVSEFTSATCIKSESKPVRIQLTWLGGERYIETTPNNADRYEKLCVKYATGNLLTPQKNIETIVANINNQKEVKQ